MEDRNPYEPPQTASDPPQRPPIDEYYRLRQFLVMLAPAIAGTFAGYYFLRHLFFPSPEGCGAALGGLLGLAVGIIVRIAIRRR